MLLGLFFVLASIAVAGALGLIFFRSPVHSALSLLLTFFAMGGIYVLLQAPVLAVFQVAVYAGAIMVLFVFVVMFLNLNDEGGHHPDDHRRALWMMIVALLILTGLLILLAHLPISDGRAMPDNQATVLGQLIFARHAVAFELVSILLLAAAIGAVALNRKEPF